MGSHAWSAVLSRAGHHPPLARSEITLALLRSGVAAIGAVQLLLTRSDPRAPAELTAGALVLAALAVASLLLVWPLARLATPQAVRRAAAWVTAGDLLAVAAYAAYFSDRPGAGSAYPAFVLIAGPVRWGWWGVVATAVPVGVVASLWPQQTLSESTYGIGQIWLLVGLFAVVTVGISAASRRTGARLRQAQEQFQAAFEHASIGMALLDEVGALVRGNDALADLAGVPTERLVGASLVDLAADQHGHRLAAALLRLGPERPAERLEVRLARPDGQTRWGMVALSWVPGGDGVPARVVVQVEDVTDRHEAQQRMTHLATHDHLTGLPNRALLRSRLAAALEGRDALGVLFVDLDRFKVVNDGLGHDVGDRLLAEVAGRLAGVVRPRDLVARIGGDEFVLLCLGVSEPDRLVALGRRVQEVLRPPVELDGERLHVTVSVGAAVAGPGATADALLRDADAAMYAAKSSGGNRVQLFSRVLQQRALHARELELGLRRALDEAAGEEPAGTGAPGPGLGVVYQPVVDLATGRVSGLEALARWSHPVWGQVPPVEFVAAAEKSDLVVELGTWVLRRALRDARDWPAVDGAAPSVAVNVSPRQLTDGDFPALVGALLAEAGLPGERLSLEITETALIGDVPRTVLALRALRELGVRLAIDDFGTGHASLAYLTRFPVDTVKIDRTFVTGVATDAGSAAIVGGVVAMAHAYGLRVVAEGAETAEQLGALRRLGCEFAQGYVLSRPLDRADVAAALGVSGLAHLVPAPRTGARPATGAAGGAAGLDEARRYRLLLDCAREISGCLDLDEVLRRAFAALGSVVTFTGGSIQVVEQGALRLAAAQPAATDQARAARLPLGQGIGGQIALTGEPRYLPDVTVVAALKGRPAVTSGGVRSYYGVPLLADGEVIGLLQIDSVEVDAWDERDRLLVLAFASVVAPAVRTAQAYRQSSPAG